MSNVFSLPDGKIIVYGGFSHFDGMARKKIVRLMPDGSLDQTFDARFDQRSGSSDYFLAV